MGAYALRRLLQLPLVLLGISLVVFLIMALLPGDPALAILGPYATPDALATLRADLGLEQPLWSRFWHWLSAALQGDLGRSISLQRPVADEIAERLGPTLLLASSALGLSVLLGLAAGIEVAVVNLQGQALMAPIDNPFRCADEMLTEISAPSSQPFRYMAAQASKPPSAITARTVARRTSL